MTGELLRQVRVIDPVSEMDRVADVLIVDNQVQAIADRIQDLPEGTEVCDRPGLVLGPGLMDLYSHSGEPGFESRETLASLVTAAAAGGFTRVTLLPDTEPAIDHPAAVEQVRAQSRKLTDVAVQIGIWGALTLGGKGEQMTELAELATAGVAGFADAQPLRQKLLVQRLLEYLQPLQKPVALWPCDRSLSGDGVVREGVESMRLGLPGSPAVAETSALASLLECVAEIGTPIHIMRVSTARSVELIASAKASGLPVTASTTWMHLLLNVTAVQSYDPSLHLDPPLGNPVDQAALIEGVQQGVLDAIAIDHAPYTYEEKTVAFAESPAGAIGLELALPLLWHTFVATGVWSPLLLWRCLSTNPARCLQQQPAQIALGSPTEMTLFDPQATWQVDSQTLNSLAMNTPWLEKSLTGRVLQIWGNGSRSGKAF